MNPLALEARVAAFVEERLPSLRGSAAVLAASGGADSTAMVALLCEASLIDRGRSIVAHFDHRLRDPETARHDRDAVQALADRCGLALVIGSWDAPSRGEQAARDARYRFLQQVGEARGIEAAVTGHTRDDQAETVLMRIQRGAGVHGLAGMPADARWPLGGSPVRIWRPLLDTPRAETRTYCEQHGLTYHDDESNGDRRITRNAVRLDLLPALERADPHMRESLIALAANSREIAAGLDQLARTAIVASDQREVVIAREALGGASEGVAASALRLACIRLLGDACDIGRAQYRTFARAQHAQTGATFELARGLIITVDRHVLIVSHAAAADPAIRADVAHPLPWQGVVGAWRLDIEPSPGGIALPDDAVVRARRPGDRIRPLGLGGSKKLQDYFVDRHVPRRLRDAAPLIADGPWVYWTPFGRGEVARGASACYRVEAVLVRPAANLPSS